MVNSGTNQDAILDFTIPQGANGSAAPLQLLSAYSTPPQPGTSGGTLSFDKNSNVNGSAITHTEGSPDFSITEPGVYNASFNGALAPGSDSTFPLNLRVYLQQDGNPMSGASAIHTFQSASDTSTLSFSHPVSVSSTPSTLQIGVQGGNYLYSDNSLTINKLGDLS